MIVDNFLAQLLPCSRRGIRKEEHLFAFMRLNVLQRLERLSDFIAGVEKDTITIENEIVVLLDEVL